MKIRTSLSRLVPAIAGFCILIVLSHSVFALEPDEIALVVNSNVPQGGELAQFYAQQRHIPDNRILVLDLPKADQMSCREYEDHVVPTVRDFLHTGNLEGKIKCLVTFYGVPLRIEPRVNTPAEDDELQKVRRELEAMPDQIRPPVEAIEALAKTLNADFNPDPFGDLDHLVKRKNVAFQELSKQIQSLTEKPRQVDLLNQFLTVAQPLLGDKARIDQLTLRQGNPAIGPPVNQKDLDQSIANYKDAIAQATIAEKTPDDASARQKLRDIAKAHFGSVQYLNLLRDQADYLDTRDSGAAFDSELAMVNWNAYPHRSFLANPLNYQSRPTGPQWRTLMVTRLDAPDPQTVKSMITTSIKVEHDGLTGRVVIDSLGVKSGEEKPEQKGYGVYDQLLRDLYKLLKTRTSLDVVIDEKPEVLPPNSYDNVALYVGWYSVHNYVPCCKFNPGAVGFHIASYELITLRGPGDNGWVRGLLNDGVVGTLGPVAEPYLGTFPHPDEYFPLLLTGKLTLAEVYWRTTPAVSWMMACIGDPLYNPYKFKPAMTETDLPFRLRKALKSPEAAN